MSKHFLSGKRGRLLKAISDDTGTTINEGEAVVVLLVYPDQDRVKKLALVKSTCDERRVRNVEIDELKLEPWDSELYVFTAEATKHYESFEGTPSKLRAMGSHLVKVSPENDNVKDLFDDLKEKGFTFEDGDMEGDSTTVYRTSISGPSDSWEKLLKILTPYYKDIKRV